MIRMAPRSLLLVLTAVVSVSAAEASPERAEIQKGHMAHLDAMWKAGKHILPDPLESTPKTEAK